MSTLRLALRTLAHYWQTTLAVAAGVAVAVAVLAGALGVGESVRASLRELAVGRLGATDVLVASTHFFRAALPADLIANNRLGAGGDAYGLIALDGMAVSASTGARLSGVSIYGVDERFWTFHGRRAPGPLRARDAWVSPALARDLGLSADAGSRADNGVQTAAGGGAILLRMPQPSAIPLSTLQGRRDESGQTIRVTVRGTLPADRMGEFSLRPHQGDVRAVFVPIARLQADLSRPASINAVLIKMGEAPAGQTQAGRTQASGTPEAQSAVVQQALAASLQLADAGLKLRSASPAGTIAVESDAGLLTDRTIAALDRTASARGWQTVPVLAYLAHTIRVRDREIPYSIVAAVDLPAYAALEGGTAPASAPQTSGGDPPIWLNAWAAERLGARPGERVDIAYDVWEDGGGLVSRSTSFVFAGVVPMDGAGGDRTLTPEYPGITDQENVAEWDPPFPLDLSRISDADEDYWRRYRAAPKAFITPADGQRLWRSRFGQVSSVRLRPRPASASESGSAPAAALAGVASALVPALDLETAGLLVQPVRAAALTASAGTTDFGEYFLYFSFFLVVAAVLLAALFFRMGVEQRIMQVGLFQAVGLTPRQVRRALLLESVAVAFVGALLGAAGAVAYAALILAGLRTWWRGAVGTSALTLHVSWTVLAIGVATGVIVAVGSMLVTLRRVSRQPARALLHGDETDRLDRASAASSDVGAWGGWRGRVALLCGLLAAALLVASMLGVMPREGGFFGAGGLLLCASLLALSVRLRRPRPAPLSASSARGLWRLGGINASARPGRTTTSVALMAFATFVIVSTSAFKRDVHGEASQRASGTGGFALWAESVAPILDDPRTASGRRALGLDTPELRAFTEPMSMTRFRVRPGDDSSCLNLYRPENPRLIAPEPSFVQAGERFIFDGSLAATDAERANPWTLLNRVESDGTVPAIVDSTSLTYVFHKKLGDVIAIPRGAGDPLRLKVVASLSHSLFQSELILSDANFVRFFPSNDGYRLFLVEADASQAPAISALLDDRLSNFGVRVQGTADRLAAYQQVENTYLSTFQALGSLGLLLGTLGVGAVLLRNVLERRRDIALLRAVGYTQRAVAAVVLAETLTLIGWGLAIGSGCALLAILPAILERGGTFPWFTASILLLVVIAVGVGMSRLATAAAARVSVTGMLRAE